MQLSQNITPILEKDEEVKLPQAIKSFYGERSSEASVLSKQRAVESLTKTFHIDSTKGSTNGQPKRKVKTLT